MQIEIQLMIKLIFDELQKSEINIVNCQILDK